MRIIFVLAALLIICGAANASPGFSWSEDFEGDGLASYWQLHGDDLNFAGVVQDPTNETNHVLRVDTYDDAGSAYADVLDSAFDGLDGTQEVTASFKFYLDYQDPQAFTILGMNFTALADAASFTSSDTLYGTGTGEDPFEIPVGQWMDFKYEFTPNPSAGVTTHKVYLNNTLMGTFENVPSGHDGAAFFLGDDEADYNTWGAGMWDDICVTGAPKAPETPEPGSLLSLLGGVTALGGMALRRKSSSKS